MKKKKVKKMAYVSVLDKRTKRRVFILNEPGSKNLVTGEDYLFVGYEEPHRGIVVKFDDFFLAMKKLVDSTFKNTRLQIGPQIGPRKRGE